MSNHNYTGPYKGKLTPENLALVQETLQTSMTNALSTERCDRETAQAAVTRLYELNGMTPPAFIWMDSPLGGIYALSTLKVLTKESKTKGDQLWDQLGGQLWDQLGDQLWGQLGGQLRGQLRGQLGGQLGDQLWDQLGDQLGGQLRGQLRGQLGGQLGGQLWDQLGGQLGGQLWDQLRDQLGDQLWDQLGDQLGGQLRGQLKEDYYAYNYGFTPWYDAYWTALYSKAYKIAELQAPEILAKLDAFTTATESVGWWYATPSVAFMTERPTVITRDAQARLHGPHSAALQYADGYSLNAWHGTRLPEDFHTKEWTLEAVMKEQNTEVRRCAIESTGWDKFIAESGMEPVGPPVPDPGNAPFELALYDLPAALDGLYTEKARVLLATNGTVERDGTRHKYGLIVPATHTDPLEAAANLYGVTKKQYASLQVRK